MYKNYDSLRSGRDTWLKNDVGDLGSPPILRSPSSQKSSLLYRMLLCMLILVGMSVTKMSAQVLIDPAGDGGFNNGTSFASNGWTASNATVNNWVVGTALSTLPFSGRSAYVSNNGGAAHAYTNSVTNHIYFYRDVAIPVGSVYIPLSFNWIANGNDPTDFDIMQVFIAPTSITPVGSTTYPGSGAAVIPADITGATILGAFSLQTTAQTANLIIPNSFAGQTVRLMFMWKSDGSVGTNPPSAVDNISLTASNTFPTITATAAGGLWSSPATWVGGVVPSGSDAAIPAGSVVTVDSVVSIHDLTVNGTLQWNGTSNAMTLSGSVLVNSGGSFLAHTSSLASVTVNVAGNFQNDGYANFAPSALVFNGNGSTLSGSGTFLGDGTRGIIRFLGFNSLGSSTISTTQNLTTTFGVAHTAGSLNTNGKIKVDNTAQVYGLAINQQVQNIAVTAMGSAYSVAPVVFGAAFAPYPNTGGTLTANSRYYSGSNVYLCTVAGTSNGTAPVTTGPGTFTTSGGTLLWIGTTGTLGTPFQVTSVSSGTQVFYGGNLYVCTVTGVPSAAAPPVHTSGAVASGAATFLYVGTPATATVNYDGTTQTVRSLTLTSAGSGLSAAPSISFAVGVVGGAGSGATATAVFIQQVVGQASSTFQKSGVATISGGLTINSDQGASVASADVQSSTGVGAVSTTNGGVNYGSAPTVGFAGPTNVNLITNTGSGYAAAPTITVTGGTLITGSALTTSNFTITVNNGVVESVYLNGSTTATYSVPPTLSFSSGSATLAFPAGCWPTATASVSPNGQVTNFTITNAGYGYIAAPTVGVTGGTPTTAATTPTARIGVYNLTLNFFSPAVSVVAATDDATIPPNRKINTLTLAGNGNGLNLTGNLILYGTTGLSLTASVSAPGNILDMGGNTVTCTNVGFAGATATVGATNAFVKNGSWVLTGRGGASTFNFPFGGTFNWFAGSTPTPVTTGSNALTVKVSDTTAPSNALTGGTGVAMGNRAFRVQTATTFGAAATTGTNPTISMSFNGVDGLTTTQDQTFVADGTSLTGPWTIRSTSFGASGSLPATGSKATLGGTAPGPIAITGDNYYAWATGAPTVTDFSPLTVCASSGTFTITGTNLTGVSGVSIGGTPVNSFLVVNATTITGVAGSGTSGVVSVTKNGGSVSGVQSITVTGSAPAPSVAPVSASIIPGGAVSFTATGSGGTMKWYDAATGGTLLFTGATYNTNVCTTRSLYVAEDNGSCEGQRAAVPVTVQAIVVTPTVSSFCGSGGTTTFNVTPSDPSITYTWTALTPSASFVGSNVGSSVDASLTETSEFKVTATTAAGGCSIDSFISIGVYPLPTATVTTTADGVCPGTSATINSGLSAGNFTSTSITFAPRTAPGTATTLVTGGTAVVAISGGTATPLDDVGWGNIPIGFNFNFFGTNFSTINVGSNGVVQFGSFNANGDTAPRGLSDFTFTTLPSTTEPFNIVAILAMDNDLSTSGGFNGTIKYWTEGYAPNRRFIVSYENVREFGDTKISTSQGVFYETTGVVEVHVTSSTNVDRVKVVGVNNANGTIGVVAYVSGTTASASPQNPISTSFAYRFSPPSNYTTTWFANGVQFITGTNIFSQVVSPTVTTTYSITYTNQTTLCTNAPGSAQVVMNVLGTTAPTGVNTLSNHASVCYNETVNLSTSYAGSNAGLTFQWQASPSGLGIWTNIPGATASTATSEPILEATDYRLGIISCGGTVGYTNPVTVTLTNNITASSGATRCGIGTVNLTASGTPGADINWYTAASGGTSIHTGSPFTPTVSSTTTYYVAAETPGCTSARVAVVATVNAAPALTLSASAETVCEDEDSALVTITAGSSDYDIYNWSPSLGVSGTPGAGWTFSADTTTTFTLTASQSAGGCVNVATFVLTVNEIGLEASADPMTICNGASVTLNAESIILGEGPHVSPVGYAASNSNNDTDEDILNVTIGALNNTSDCFVAGPGASVLSNYGDYTGLTPINITAGATIPISISVGTCDDDFDNFTNVYIDYNRNGIFEAGEHAFTGADATGANIQSGNIVVPSDITAGWARMRVYVVEFGDATSSPSTTYGWGETEDYTVNLIGAIDQSGDLDYEWNPGALAGQSVVVSPSTTTVYTVTATNPLTGCSKEDTVTVTVNPLPLAPTGTDSAQCGNQVPTASVADNNAFVTPTFKWYADNVTTTALQSSTSTTYTTAINTTTTFYVSVVNGATGCESTRTPVTVTVSTADAIMASPGSSTVCPGEPVNVSISSVNTNYTYTWTALPSSGSGITGSLSGSSNSITPTLPGTYTYTVNAVDGVCSTFTTFTITAVSNPSLSASATPTTLCNGGISTLTAVHRSFTFSTSTGAALDPMAGATDVLTTGNDDDATPTSLPIGFTFNFNGVNFSDYSVSPDGWILLGTGIGVDQFTNATTSTTNTPKLYPYWDDMATGLDGNVKALVTGSAPNRILVLEWNVTVPRNLSGNANAKFQAWLYETSNRIEYRYGTMATTTGSASSGYTINATKFSSITFSNNTESKSVANDNNTGVPASGRMYAYDPLFSTITWSPSTDLYTDAGATIPYAGEDLDVVFSKPTATTVYTVTAESAAGCTTEQNVTVTNNSINIAAITGGANDYCIGSPSLDFDTATPGVTWTSSNPAVATVDSSGVVTALTAGTTIIGATITNAGCTTVAPNPQTVVINDQVQIVSFTASQTVLTNGNTSFNVNATGTGLTYQWMVNEAPGFTGFVNVVDDAVYAGAQSATLNLTAVPASFNGNLYHVVVSGLGVCAPKTSNPDSPLTVGDTGIGSHPTDVTICETTTVATFTVVATGDDSGGYQWQEQVGGAGPWTNITNGGIYADATTPTLSLSGLTLAQSTNKYRAVVTGAVTSATSNPATLTINQAITVQTNPANQNVCFSGGSASFSSTATGLITSRQWQYSTNGVSGWASVVNGTPTGATYTGGTTGTLNVTTTAATPTTGHYYRLFYDAPLCADANSTAGQMIIFTPSATSPGTQNFCAGVATSAIPITGTGTTYNISGGAAIGLANQTGVTSIPSFTPIAGTATITLTPIASGCTGPNTTFTINVNALPGTPTTGPVSPVCEGTPLNLTSSTVTIPGYTMNGNSGVSFIDINATGTSVGTVSDDSEHNITIPSFTFNGVAFTTARVGMNGVIALGSTTGDVSTANVALPTTANSAGNVFLAPYWDDLDIQTAASVKTQTVGNVFIIQYTTAAHDSFTTDSITFQVQLNLTTGTVTYVYTDVIFTGSTGLSSGLSATVGIQLSSSSAVQFSLNTASLTAGQSITFTPNSASYAWTGPNSFSSNLQNPNVTATASAANAGTYTLTVTNTATGCQRVVTRDVIITPAVSGGTVSGTQTACPNTTPSDLTLSGNVGAVVRWERASDMAFTSPVTINNTTTTLTGAEVGAINATTYVRAVVQSGSCGTANSSVATISVGNTSTWTVAGGWSNGTPTSTTAAIINGNYTAAADFNACSLTIQSGTVSFPGGFDAYVNGKVTVTSGSLTFEDGSDLVQVRNDANTGNIKYKRTANLIRQDYVYWSSPVSGQMLQAYSPGTLNTRFYNLDEPTNSFAQVASPSTTSFDAARGYMIRSANNHPAVLTPWTGTFTGVPRNGEYTIPVTVSGQGYNMIGNPYPSTIDADLYLAQAGNEGTLYFWTHISQAAASGANYATYNLSGGTAAQSGGSAPTGAIRGGQGFVQLKTSAGSATFTNAMRTAEGGAFYRSGSTVEKHRMWFNLNTPAHAMNQILVGYIDGATMAADTQYDGKLIEGGSSISSIIGSTNYVIQARSLPFVDTDVVPLSFNAGTAGTYIIELDHVDGLFEGDQNIYLKDNLLGTVHNIKQGAYSFASAEGTFANRFEVVYQSSPLGVETPTFDANSVVVYKEQGMLHINSGTTVMSGVKIFDIRGRLIYERNAINATETVLNDLRAEEQVLLVQITSVDNEVVTKKVAY